MSKHNTILISHTHLVDVWLKFVKELPFRTIQERNGNYTHIVDIGRQMSATEIWHLCMEFNEWKAIERKLIELKCK
jgi:hypothetical protein